MRREWKRAGREEGRRNTDRFAGGVPGGGPSPRRQLRGLLDPPPHPRLPRDGGRGEADSHRTASRGFVIVTVITDNRWDSPRAEGRGRTPDLTPPTTHPPPSRRRPLGFRPRQPRDVAGRSSSEGRAGRMKHSFQLS